MVQKCRFCNTIDKGTGICTSYAFGKQPVAAWNENRDHREKIYISYDSTNKNCQAGDMRFVESGHPKDDRGLPVFNYSIAYDTYNKEPLFYEQYPGSIVDISQLRYMLKKAEGYGYKKVGFILDRGYFGRENIQYMDECGYDFVIMVKGMSESVRRMILENKGEFENIRKYNIRKYKTFGKTIKKKLYISDEKERYFHIYYSDQKACVEHEQIEAKIDRMTKYLNSLKGEKATVGDGYKKYFKLEIYEDDGTIICARERTEVIREEIDLYVFSGECQCEYRKFAVSSIAKDKNTRIFYKICVKCLLYLCVIFGKII